MAELGARHDKSAADRAGYRFHAAEYRSGSGASDRQRVAGMRNGTDGREQLGRTGFVLALQSHANELRVFPSLELMHRREAVSRPERGVVGTDCA